MSLNLSQLLPQLDEMGASASNRARDLAEAIPRLRQDLSQAAGLERDLLQEKISRAGSRWSGAIPTAEKIDAAIAPSKLTEAIRVIGADGSQVYPNRHAPALFYLLNIGSISIHYGSGNPPSTASQATLHYHEGDLFDEYGRMISNDLIDGRRDVQELGTLARLGEDSQEARTLALLDNGLLLWLALQTQGQSIRAADQILREYLGQMDRLRESCTALAGFVDRPRSANIISLLHLAGLPLASINEATLRSRLPASLSDYALFTQILPPEHRSARFTRASPVDKSFQQRGHQIQFFYLNCGPGGQIARVEVPHWVGDDQDLLNLVHAGIVDQCRDTQGFPYALIRAHELAVISQEERKRFENMIKSSLLRHGLHSAQSRKAQTKKWIRDKRRHHL